MKEFRSLLILLFLSLCLITTAYSKITFAAAGNNMPHVVSQDLLDKEIHTTHKSPEHTLPLVAIVTTGGTIAEKEAKNNAGEKPSLSGEQLLESVPELATIAKIKLIDFMNIDSSQMTPTIWNDLAKAVIKLENDPDIVGIVITHGTDTMALGAYYLSLVLPHTKPIIFTGAIRSASSRFSDGAFNLYNAVVQATKPQVKHWGVTINFNQNIFSAQYARKVNTINAQTFSDNSKGNIGCIEGKSLVTYNPPKTLPVLHIPDHLPKVALITTYAGDDGAFIRAAANLGYAGIVIETFGAGNVNAETYKAIKYALSKNVIVVDSSRVNEGGVWPIYGDQGGAAVMQKSGVILAGNIIGSKARLLLMVALANDITKPQSVQQVFNDYQ